MSQQTMYRVDKDKFANAMRALAWVWEKAPGLTAPSNEGWRHTHGMIEKAIGEDVTYEQYVRSMALVYLETIMEAAMDNEHFANTLAACIEVINDPTT